ncbi:MAG: metallophosphoesterase [candidate division WOR-3 bacterium]|nr:metallophosphoesterase [candidate division WOR-3 bacterium]
MRTIPFLAGLLSIVAIATARNEPFTFAVLGDRAGDAQPEVFHQILAEIALFNPDFIICTGNLIQGYAADAAATNAQWDTITGQLRSTGIPYFVAPGNHDIWNPASESVFTKRVGRPAHTFKRGNSIFIFLDNSRWPVDESLPLTEQRWLDKELTQTRKYRHAFVLMHRPYWRYALDRGRTELLHGKFKASGIDYVFTGSDRFYCSHTWDSIHYFQVGPSGSRTMAGDDPGAGEFQNYLLCRVSGDTVRVIAREPGRDEPLPVDTVTYESIRALETAKKQAVALGAVPVPYAGPVAASLPLTVRNVTAMAMTDKLSWSDSLTAWRIAPREITFSISPQGHIAQAFEFNLTNLNSLYPLPVFSAPYEYAPGRKTAISRSLPIRREAALIRATTQPVLDGRLTDGCWKAEPTLRTFGGRSGGVSAVEPTAVWVARDDTLLYIAARCTDSRSAELKTDATARDGKVSEDDNLDLLLSFNAVPGADTATYYQVVVNSSGTIADRICRLADGDSLEDDSWNGSWQVAAGKGADYWAVEMSCPLSDFGNVGPSWGVNASRFQSRTKDVAVWQVPFEHNPAGFGLLKPTK